MIRRFFYRALDHRWIVAILAALGLGGVAWLCWGEDVQVTDVVVAVFAVVAGIATVLGWYAMDQQNKIMLRQMAQTDETLEHMRRGQRAWVSAECEFDETEGIWPPKCRIRAVNTGASPAQITRFAGELLATDGGPSGLDGFVSGLPINDPRSVIAAVVAPNDHATFHIAVNMPVSIDPEEARQGIESGAVTLYLAGIIGYEDVFGRPCETGFCYYFNLEKRRFFATASHSNMR